MNWRMRGTGLSGNWSLVIDVYFEPVVVVRGGEVPAAGSHLDSLIAVHAVQDTHRYKPTLYKPTHQYKPSWRLHTARPTDLAQ